MSNSLIQERAEQAIRDKVFPGCVVGVVNKEGERTILPFGNFTYESNSQVVAEDTVYDTASITKTIPIALIALTFIGKGMLSLEDQIIKYLPEITIPNAEKGLIKHLLTYTYILQKNADQNFSYEHLKAKDIFDFLFRREFEFLPGTHYQYGNAPANLLGVILERISGKNLYDLAREIVLEPLQMVHATFYPDNKNAIPPTEMSSWRGKIQGDVHDDTAFILQKEGFHPGCAGLFANAGDLLNMAEMMLNEGVYKGNRVFTPETIVLMTNNALSGIGQSCGIGWELNQPKFMGSNAHEHMVGKTGFTGTCVIIDPKTERAFVILSNKTYPSRPQSGQPMNAFRCDIADALFSTL